MPISSPCSPPRLLLFLFLLCWAGISLAAAAERAGVLVYGQGRVEVATAGGGWVAAHPGLELHPGDRIRTGADGRAGVRLVDETLVRLNRRTLFELRQVGPRAGLLPVARRGVRSLYRLQYGEFWMRNDSPTVDIEVRTPTVTAGIRGTALNLRLGPGGKAVLSVLEGRVVVSDTQGALEAGGGEQVIATPGAPLRKVRLLRPRDAVQWTLRIPRLIPTGAGPRSVVARALGLLEQGDLTGAEERLRGLARTRPEVASVWQALAVTALLLDHRVLAREAARRGLKVDPDDSGAWLVRGYVAQADFDLETATAAYRKAVALDRGNLVAWLSLARVLFGADRTAEARAALERARVLAPDDPGVTLLDGFLSLAEGATQAALAAFDRTLLLDPGEGEAWLGKALALMRRGDTQGAFDAMATAVLLQPGRSLFLSYWGKMLYQVGRFQRALRALNSAREADPRDPTPWHYRALILRDLNRPGEAIEALQEAMARNGNRAVYRSRFLLDRDQASRNVDLSLLYSALGLNAWAGNRALASVKQDYLNAAAHTFYAGGLANREGRSRAFATEALLGRLLQPANINSFNSFNEYTTLFERPGAQGTLTLEGGDQGFARGEFLTYGADPGHSLAYGLLASASTDEGWGGDNGSRLRGLSAQAKWEPRPGHDLTLSLGYGSTKDRGDPLRRYEVTVPADPLKHSDIRGLTGELGYHLHLEPGSDLLAVLAGARRDLDSSDHQTFPFDPSAVDGVLVDVRGREVFQTDYLQGQVEWLRRLGRHQWLLGATAYRGERSIDGIDEYGLSLGDLFIPVPDLDERHQDRADVSFYNLYAQDIWNLRPDLTLEAALYLERMRNANLFSGGRWELDTVDPRLGLSWRPGARDTLRLAAFRYLLPFVSTRMDPADIAGIPVYRAASVGALVEEADLVWEHTWPKGFFSAGLFALHKERHERFPVADGPDLDPLDEAYAQGLELEFNRLLGGHLGLAAGYRALHAQDAIAPDADRREHLLTLGLRYVGGQGLRAGLAQTLRVIHFDNQRGDEFIPITDLDVGYELPHKRGVLRLTVANLFDRRFNWVTDRFVLLGRVPARQIRASISLTF